MTRPVRTVVVGNGMAAVRLVEGLLARGVSGLTVISAEPHAPYNRVLLPDVLAGTHRAEALTLHPVAWYADHGVDLRLGTPVVRLHRAAQEVELADGARVAYDRLVLATGSTLPRTLGEAPAGATHTLEHLDDCHRLSAALAARAGAAGAAGRPLAVAVVGAGLLGLQVARALSLRGARTVLVEAGPHVLARRVDAAAGAVLGRRLAALGIEVLPATRALGVEEDGLRLAHAPTLPVDVVVLAGGARPSVSLAAEAGLPVGRGVVVDDTLATADPRVWALGACAEHDGRAPGFVARAWAQADVLAARLAGEDGDGTYRPRGTVARLRADGLEAAVLGEPGERGPDDRAVAVSNPVAGTHRELVVRGGAIVAATLVGDLSRVGVVGQAFARGTRLGDHEPLRLLAGDPAAPGAPGDGPPDGLPDSLPDGAEVCACAGVTAGRLRACTSLAEARATTRAATGCGGCAAVVAGLVGATRVPA